PRKRDVGLALLGIIRRQGSKLDRGFGVRQPNDLLGKLADREFARISEVDRSCEAGGRVHQSNKTAHGIIDIAEGSRLRAIAEQRDRLALQRLHDEVRNDAPVVRVHARPVRVEDASNLDREFMLAVIIEEQRLRAALAFIVAGARADWIDIPPITLSLRM